jgi:hypothetical protein
MCCYNRRRKEKESFYAVVRRQREHDIALKKLHSALSQQDKQDNIERCECVELSFVYMCFRIDMCVTGIRLRGMITSVNLC